MRKRTKCRTSSTKCNYRTLIGSLVAYRNSNCSIQYHARSHRSSGLQRRLSLGHNRIQACRQASWESIESQPYCLLRSMRSSRYEEQRDGAKKERENVCVFLGGRRNQRTAVSRRCINNRWRQVRYVGRDSSRLVWWLSNTRYISSKIADSTIRKTFRNQILFHNDIVNSSFRSRCVHFYAGINPFVKSRDAWRGIDSPRNKYNRSSGISLCNASVGRASYPRQCDV